ncbi:MAG: phospholipase [Bacteroidaceae bacterium]|nr:phospholipase [Bacteroidaceae bacterium]MBR5841995.1 phospholipase [Bacteroidaceae bacterium]
MNIAVYSAAFLGALVGLSLIGRLIRKKNGAETIPSSTEVEEPIAAPEEEVDDDEECCGEHEVCEKGKIKRALRTDIEYFDDEELDRFRGTASDEYEDEAVEEFREVLYTMDPREVDDWLKSLELREVTLPDALKDEVFMLLRGES